MRRQFTFSSPTGGPKRVFSTSLTTAMILLAGAVIGFLPTAVEHTSAAVSVGSSSTISATDPPEPSANPPRWQLKFEVTHDLRLIQLDGQWYWFMTYMVTNKTKEDQLFVPEAVLSTDAGDIIKDSENVSLDVTNELLNRIGNPLLESKTHIVGKLMVGKENAREGLLIWKAGKLEDLREARVFIGGLSSDTQVVKDPVTSKDVTVRKNLERIYDVPGIPTFDPQDCAIFREQKWIMR